MNGCEFAVVLMLNCGRRLIAHPRGVFVEIALASPAWPFRPSLMAISCHPRTPTRAITQGAPRQPGIAGVRPRQPNTAGKTERSLLIQVLISQMRAHPAVCRSARAHQRCSIRRDISPASK
jgi:hypothetical protein